MAVALVGLLLGAIATSAIKMGPSSIALPEDAATLSASWYRFPDINPEGDYYIVLVRVHNGVDTPSVYPYALRANLTAIGGQITDHFPQAGNHAAQETIPLSWGGSPPDIRLTLPAGMVTLHQGADVMLWDVAGKGFLESRPVFTTSADLYIEFVVPENATMEVHSEVVVDWYYANVLQAYTVATLSLHAVCLYTPPAGSEGTAPYASCP